MGSLNIYLCIGIGVVWLGNLMHMSGMATPRWVEYYEEQEPMQYGNKEVTVKPIIRFSGLFEECTPEKYDNDCEDLWFNDAPMKRQVAQVLAYLGLVFGLIGSASAVVYQLIILLSQRRLGSCGIIVATSIATTSCLAAFGFILSLISLFADRFVKEYETLDYSFYLCLLAAALFLAGSVLITYAGRSLSLANSEHQNGTPPANSKEPSVVMRGSAVEIKMSTEGDDNEEVNEGFENS